MGIYMYQPLFQISLILWDYHSWTEVINILLTRSVSHRIVKSILDRGHKYFINQKCKSSNCKVNLTNFCFIVRC